MNLRGIAILAFVISCVTAVNSRAAEQKDGAIDAITLPVDQDSASALQTSGPEPVATATTAQGQMAVSSKDAADGLGQFLSTASMPAVVAVLSGVAGLVAGIVAAVGTLIVTPRVNRKIADKQAEIYRDAVSAAEASAQAANLGASAASKSAEVAALNAQNVGIHEVARRRQEWINALRDDLAHLHSDLMNWTPLAPDASLGQRSEYNDRVRATNARIAKVRLRLNPREVASRRLLQTIERLNGTEPPIGKRMWLCRWLIRWGQVIMKSEWDRVRNELLGIESVPPRRRAGRR